MCDSFEHVIQGALSGQKAVSADGVATVLRRCFEWVALDWRVSRRFEFVTKEERGGWRGRYRGRQGETPRHKKARTRRASCTVYRLMETSVNKRLVATQGLEPRTPAL